MQCVKKEAIGSKVYDLEAYNKCGCGNESSSQGTGSVKAYINDQIKKLEQNKNPDFYDKDREK